MDNLNSIPNSGNWGEAASKLNDNFNKVKQAITTVENASKNNKGYFSSLSALNTAFPNPKAGQTAYVYSEASSTKYYIYNAFNGGWVTASVEAPTVGVDIADYTKSGGSSKTTKQIEDEIVQLAGEETLISISWQSGMVDLNGVIVAPSNNYFYSAMIPVNEGEVYIASLSGSENVLLVSGYSKNSQVSFVRSSDLNIAGNPVPGAARVYFFIIPRGIKYIRVVRAASTPIGDIYLKKREGSMVSYLSKSDKYISDSNESISHLSSVLDVIAESGNTEDVFDQDVLVDGGLNGSTGEMVETPTGYYWRRTPILPIRKNSVIRVEGWQVDPEWQATLTVACFDSPSGGGNVRVRPASNGGYYNGDKQYFAVFITRTTPATPPDYTFTKILVTSPSIKPESITGLPASITASHLSEGNTLLFKNKEVLVLDDIPISNGSGVEFGKPYFSKSTGALNIKLNKKEGVEICKHRFNKNITFVEQTDTINIANATSILSKAVSRGIRLGAFIRHDNIPLDSYIVDRINDGYLRLDTYFPPKLEGDPSQIYTEAEYDVAYNTQKNWFLTQFSRVPSTFSYGYGYTTYTEFAKKYFLAGRNSDFTNMGDPYSGYLLDNWISKPSSYRWYDQAKLIGVDDALTKLSQIIDKAMQNSSIVFNFTHWHQMASPVAPELDESCYDNYFDMLSLKNTISPIHFCSFGEAVEYLVFRESITNIQMTEQGNTILIEIESDLTVQQKSLINTPLTIKIDLLGTVLEGKTVSLGAGEVYEQDGNSVIIEVPKNIENIIVSATI